MRTRLVIAFIIVALLSAVASSWFHTLIGAYRLPGWLHDVIMGPGWLQGLVHTAPGQAAPHPIRALQQMEARARQFAGDVSHELRTPPTAMTAVVGILHEHPGLTGDAAAAAGLVQQEVQHLNRLVEDLIEISRFDAGTAQLVTAETDVANAVGQCLRTRGWSNVSADVPAGLTARLDRRRFDVVLANLVGNALRHGGLPMTVKAGIQADDRGGGQLAMEVRDHGLGLLPAAIPHVFDRFYKADAARARSEGSGLGLAIAWQNARLHGGHIHAGNHPDGGAVFTVSLPLNAMVAGPFERGDRARPGADRDVSQLSRSL